MAMTPIDDAELLDNWSVYEKYNYNASAAAAALGLPRPTFECRIKEVKRRFGLSKNATGKEKERVADVLPLPKQGKLKRYILTCAQNNTHVHGATLGALEALAAYYGAEIKVSTFTYTPHDDGSVKRGSTKRKFGYTAEERWYDARIEPYICDAYQRLAPSLVWCGHSNTLPTARDPLTGTESMNGRSSGVWPHTTIQMRAVATMNGETAKFNYTTGTVTQRNYMQKRAGLRADFHHAYGALLVEVADDGAWWARQLNTDNAGVIYDLGIAASSKGVVVGGPVEAIVFGDIHEATKDKVIVAATWGPGSLVQLLKPKRQVYHDLLDFESRSHHTRKNPHERFRLWVQGRDSVSKEVSNAAQFLVDTKLDRSVQYVVSSNHDRHLERWLRETDWRDDLPNAEFYIEAQRAMLAAIRSGKNSFNAFAWAARALVAACDAKFLDVDESLIVLKHIGGGIELGLHGDLGPNGARGSPKSLALLGRKTVIGHFHSPGVYDGCYVAGMTGELQQGYNIGPSSWAPAHVVVYPNAKRQVVRFWRGAYSADHYMEMRRRDTKKSRKAARPTRRQASNTKRR